MTVSDFEYFAIGWLLGYAWHPIWTITKKIWTEAKIASEEWNNPRK